MFWSIYCDLCAKKGKSPNAAAKEIGISSGSVTQWKNGRVPQIATLHKIAEYFNVPLETFSEDSAEKKPALEKIEKADKLFLLEQQKAVVHESHAEPWKVTLANTGLNTLTAGVHR